MDDESCLFVDHNDAFILMQDVQWNGFGLIFSRAGLRYAALDAVAGLGAVTRLFRLLVDQNLVTADQCGSQRPRTVRYMKSDNRIEPPADIGFLDENGKGAIHR